MYLSPGATVVSALNGCGNMRRRDGGFSQPDEDRPRRPSLMIWPFPKKHNRSSTRCNKEGCD